MIFATSSLFDRVSLAPEGEGGASPPPPPPAPPPPPPAPPPPPSPGGSSGTWYDGAAGLDDDAKSYIAGKGFADFGAAIKSLREIEKLATNRNVMPKPDPAKLGEWEGWEALGAPADPKKYQIKTPKLPDTFPVDQVDKDFEKAFVVGAHKARVPVAAAQAVYDHVMGYIADAHGKLASANATREAEDTAKAAAAKTALEEGLKTEWGPEFDKRTALAQRAAQTLKGKGLFGEKGDEALAKIIGDPSMMKLMHAVGEAIGEDNLVTGAGAGGAMTNHQAQAELARIDADPATKQILGGSRRDPAYRDLMEKRNALMQRIARAA